MSQVTEAPSPAAAPAEEHSLAKNALGLPQVLFCIVTGAAPLAAMMFNVPVAVSGGGYAVPAAFIVATVALTIFSTGYIEMSRRVTSTGGFYTFISHGLGRVPGMGSGLLIGFCYIIFAAAVTGVGSYFASTSIEAWTGAAIPAWAYQILFLAMMTGFAWFHIELTAKILGVALVAEVLVLLVMCVGIIVGGGGPDGYSAAPLNPANLFDNDAAIAVFGAAAVGIALFGAFWSWVGFEMAPNYAEESREPRKIAKAATYSSVIGLGVFYVFVSYMFVSGWGLTGSAAGRGRPVRGQVRVGLLPADRQVRRLRADDDGRDPDHHQLVRLLDGLLQHGLALRLLARARGRAAAPRSAACTRPSAARWRPRCWCRRSSASTCSRSRSPTRAR